MQPIIKWTGSKRLVVKELYKLIPQSYTNYYEPFVGGGSFSYYQSNKQVFCSDIIPYVIDLWLMIQNRPEYLFNKYEKHYLKAVAEHDYYFQVRGRFNQFHRPEDFFFLSRWCTGGWIRFNRRGELNSSTGYGQNGINPNRLKAILKNWHDKIQNYNYKCVSYLETNPIENSFVFCDPPYETNETVYFGSFDYYQFQEWLQKLNNRNVKWMVTTRTNIDENLYKYKTTTSGGNSTFTKILKKDDKQKTVSEYIYTNYKIL